MRKIIVILSLLFMLSQPLAARWWRTMATNGKYGYMEDADRFKKNSKAWKIPPIFDECAYSIDDNGGIAAAKKDGKWGYVDINGKFVIPATYDDIAVEDIPCYIYRHYRSLIAACYKGSWGVIDASGNTVILPLYDSIGFSVSVPQSGVPIVAYKDGIAHFLMETGEPVLMIEDCEADTPVAFENKLESMLFPVKKTDLWGYVNVTGKTIVPPRWDSPCQWLGTYAIAQKNGLYGVIDCDFNQLIPYEYDKIWYHHTSLGPYFVVRRDGYYGALAIDGNVIMPIKSKSINKVKYKRCYKVLSSRVETCKEVMEKLERSRQRLCKKLHLSNVFKDYQDETAESDAYYHKAFQSDDVNLSAYWYNRAAWLGNASAQNNLGVMLYKGSITPSHEYKLAFEWFRKASEAGLASAAGNVGLCYYYGYGTEEDFLKAIEYYSLAYAYGADEEHSMKNLANSYYCLNTLEGYKAALALYKKVGDTEWAERSIENIGILEKQLEDKRKFFDIVHKKHLITDKMRTYYNMAIDYLQVNDCEGAYTNFESAANLGMSEAEESIVNMYFSGKLAPDDYLGELYWCKRLASSTGYPPIFSYIGQKYCDMGKYSTALEWLSAAAEVGEAGAMLSLGDYYSDSENQADIDKAESYYKSAINQGLVAAEYNLSLLYYYSGRYSDALKWCGRAADHGCCDANLNYALIAEKAEVLSEHKGRVLAYMLEQAFAGDSEKKYMLALLYAKPEFSRNFNAAKFWLQKAVDDGYVDAIAHLGDNYFSGDWETERNYGKAVDLYRQAIAAGCVKAYYSLAWCYYAGKGVEKNDAEALRYTKLGIKSGSPNAMLLLAYFYCFGTDVLDKDLGQAGHWLSKARGTGQPLPQLEYIISSAIEEGK